MNPTSPQSPEPPTIQDRDHQCAASFLHRICTRRAGYPPYTRVASDTERQIGVRVSIAWKHCDDGSVGEILRPLWMFSFCLAIRAPLCCRLSGRGARKDLLSTWRKMSETLGCACPTWQIRRCHVLPVDIPLCRHCPDPENPRGPRNKKASHKKCSGPSIRCVGTTSWPLIHNPYIDFNSVTQ